MHELSESHNNRAYEAYTIDEQGVIDKITYNSQEYIFGIHYMLREIYVYVMLKFNISNILIKLLVDVLGTVIILLGCVAIIHMVDMIKKYKNNNDWIMDR